MKINILITIIYVVIVIAGASCSNEPKHAVSPNNPKMRYIVFPNQKYLEAHNIEPPLLARALIIDGNELYDDKPIEYYQGGKTVDIERQYLTLYPTVNWDIYIENLNKEIKGWDKDTDYSRISYHHTVNAVKLIIFYRGHKRKTIYEYDIDTDLRTTKTFILQKR